MTVSVSLGEICQFIGGGTPSRKIKEYWNGDIPWATVKDIQSDRISKTVELISLEGLQNSASKVVPSGTVLLVTRVGLGKVAIADVDIAINQDIKAVFPSKNVLPEFLLWTLKQLGPKIEAKGIGATVKGVTLRDIKEMQVPLPPLDEQRRIVGILNRRAKIERLRKQAAERLRELIPALFIKMFGDEQQVGIRFPRMLLREAAAIASGATKGRRIDSVDAVEVPYLRVANVQDGFLAMEEIKTITIRRGEGAAIRTRTGRSRHDRGRRPGQARSSRYLERRARLLCSPESRLSRSATCRHRPGRLSPGSRRQRVRQGVLFVDCQEDNRDRQHQQDTTRRLSRARSTTGPPAPILRDGRSGTGGRSGWRVRCPKVSRSVLLLDGASVGSSIYRELNGYGRHRTSTFSTSASFR